MRLDFRKLYEANKKSYATAGQSGRAKCQLWSHGVWPKLLLQMDHVRDHGQTNKISFIHLCWNLFIVTDKCVDCVWSKRGSTNPWCSNVRWCLTNTHCCCRCSKMIHNKKHDINYQSLNSLLKQDKFSIILIIKIHKLGTDSKERSLRCFNLIILNHLWKDRLFHFCDSRFKSIFISIREAIYRNRSEAR